MNTNRSTIIEYDNTTGFIPYPFWIIPDRSGPFRTISDPSGPFRTIPDPSGPVRTHSGPCRTGPDRSGIVKFLGRDTLTLGFLTFALKPSFYITSGFV